MTTESTHKLNTFFYLYFQHISKITVTNALSTMSFQSNTGNFEIIETNAFVEPMSTTYSLTRAPLTYVRIYINGLLSLYDYHS